MWGATIMYQHVTLRSHWVSGQWLGGCCCCWRLRTEHNTLATYWLISGTWRDFQKLIKIIVNVCKETVWGLLKSSQRTTHTFLIPAYLTKRVVNTYGPGGEVGGCGARGWLKTGKSLGRSIDMHTWSIITQNVLWPSLWTFKNIVDPPKFSKKNHCPSLFHPLPGHNCWQLPITIKKVFLVSFGVTNHDCSQHMQTWYISTSYRDQAVQYYYEYTLNERECLNQEPRWWVCLWFSRPYHRHGHQQDSNPCRTHRS